MFPNEAQHRLRPWLRRLHFPSQVPEKPSPRGSERGVQGGQRRGCAQCHSVDGSPRTGPTFQGTFGTIQPMADGKTQEVDENYIRESILQPMAKIRAGFKPVMPTYQGQLKDEEINQVQDKIIKDLATRFNAKQR